MKSSIAIVGMACIYPDARNPMELWENVLAQRRAFRRLPPERLRLDDYFSADPAAADRTYLTQAAVIEGYEFDRVAFRVVGSTFRATDLVHWLALDVVARALMDAGFGDGNGLPRETTGVLLGNTLAGEFSRSNALRLRWPYVRRVLNAALAGENWKSERREEFLAGLEHQYKSPFPPVNEETLAGGLSNTIAGRICNHFDLKGGGYTVDGACAGSLLAVTNACSALTASDLDVVIAGGVDLSLDPFEMVGFAKAGALASDEMRVFDRRPTGFWPGEGCGMVVLMRHDDALAQGRRIYAVIRGWGISSDGSTGITRPRSAGQIEALRRAYRRAGFGFETVSFCEGHGTGTAVGDDTELEVFSQMRRESKAVTLPAAIGSIKANLGHTKAAAGVAGLIKATLAVHAQVLPPTTGCEQPHAQLTGPSPALRVLREAELWPPERPLRASVSAMGFGGINAHLVLESAAAERRASLGPRELLLSRSMQDCELFLFAAESPEALSRKIAQSRSIANRISQAEMADMAAELQKHSGAGFFRAAVVATKPLDLAEKLRVLNTWLTEGVTSRLETAEGIFVGLGEKQPRIVFLFPGQGSPVRTDGGIWQRRFEPVRELYRRAGLPPEIDLASTRIAQPAVVIASLGGLKLLEQLGVTASASVGHSLGEITALHWAGALDEETLLRIARVRGAAMAELGSPTGIMVAIAASWQKVREMVDNKPVTIVSYNSPGQTVVAGEATAVLNVARIAVARGLTAIQLPVSHAFHTPLVAGAIPVLADQLAREDFAKPERTVFSTVTGARLDHGEDLRKLLCRQVTSPVRFVEALQAMGDTADLLMEVGPGTIISNLARETINVPAVALEAGGDSLKGLLQAVGAAFALGAPVKTAALFADRFTRPFALEGSPKFFVNPCELAPISAAAVRPMTPPADIETALPQAEPMSSNPIELIRRLVVERTELPTSAVRDDSRMLTDLHLNSITVGQLVSQAAKQFHGLRLTGLTDFANASVVEIARALEDLKHTRGGQGRRTDRNEVPAGVDTWVRSFAREMNEVKRPQRKRNREAVAGPTAHGWKVFASKNHPFAGSLRETLAQTRVGGVVVCVPENPGEESISLLLDGAKAVLAMKERPLFVAVQHGAGAGGFARTLHLENPVVTTCIVNVPPGCRRAVKWIASEVIEASGFTEVFFSGSGRRFEPCWKLVESRPDELRPEFSVGPADVVLITGGGKGIVAECALELARETGVKLALVGRSDPRSDTVLVENLSRFTAAGVEFCYVPADVADTSAMRRAIVEVERKLGAVTGILHGAGVNQPRLISALNEPEFLQTVLPKLAGARNLLAAVNTERLRLFVTFGSIIARTGLPGEADYAAANEWLAGLTTDFQTRHPRCRCLALEWSVWSGTGMGERLGRLESLARNGITAISIEEGVRTFCQLLRQPTIHTSLIVAGRFGEPPTLKLSGSELPLRRFLERKRVYYPGVELVVDVDLSLQTDPYLEDHVVQKQPLLPAVLGLEAMAQAAMALARSEAPPIFEEVEFPVPVIVPEKGSVTIRLVALRRENGAIEICLRSEETAFQVDHFRALCRFNANEETTVSRPSLPAVGLELLALDPGADLYGRILFHQGRFRRLRGYHLLKAKECVAEIAGDDDAAWFGPYLPAQFVLGNPGARDAALHAIQACIPHRRLLPTGLKRLIILRNETGPRLVRAKERSRDGNDFIYDVEITDLRGEIVERWEGLQLRAVGTITSHEAWPVALLGPYLERRLHELAAGSSVKVALERGVREERPASSDAVVRQALGRASRIWRRPDGKPILLEDEDVSVAHANSLTLAVAGKGGAACDLEEVSVRPEAAWRDLLGDEKFSLSQRIARECGESADTAATRLWAAMECMKKIGQPATSPLVFESNSDDGWTQFRTGSISLPTWATAVQGLRAPLVVAVAIPRLWHNRSTAASVKFARTAG